MNSAKLFEMALGLENPWFVRDIQMSKEEGKAHGQVDIYLDFERGHKFKDVSGQACAVHDTVERTWQHLNFFQHTCLLHARLPRITTAAGKVETVAVPWARAGSGFTLLFEAFSMLLIESEMPVSKAADIMDVYPQRLWNVFNYWVDKAFAKDRQEKVSVLGIDETSTRKGHNYVTVAVDMEESRVVFATPGKGADCIKKTAEHLKEKDVEAEQIKQVCIDMSPAFISGVGEHLPAAQITFDRFHVVKIVNEAMDKVRRNERKEFAMLKGHKYTFGVAIFDWRILDRQIYLKQLNLTI